MARNKMVGKWDAPRTCWRRNALAAMLGGALACVGSTRAVADPADADAFPGWETMRVVRQEGTPSRLRTADLDGNGREELIVVNTPHSRLEIYHWLERDDRPDPFEPSASRPNELPMAAELTRIELPLEHLPEDVHVLQRGEAGPPQLLVVASVPNKLLLLERAPDAADAGGDGWRRTTSWDLLPGSYTGQGALVLVRETGEGSREALISFREGVQRLTLERGARPAWLEPREGHGRANWWLVDVNGSGEPDVVEWTRQTDLALRWYESVEGRLLPAQPLHERSVEGVTVLPGAEWAAELLLLGGLQQGVVRRHRLGRGEASPLGERWALALPGGAAVPWCGVRLSADGEAVLVAAPADRPRLLSYGMTDGGWGEAHSYPSVGDVQAMAAPVGKPGTLLLMTRDASDLHVSRWEDGRFSYPKPMSIDDAAATGERRILALERVGQTVWWAQRVGADVDLYVWPADADEPQRTHLAGVGEQTHRARWLGGERLLVLDQYARAPRLVEWDAQGEAVSREPGHLQGAELDQYRLYDIAGEQRAGRLTGGVLQWLDTDLHPVDQVMLPEGQPLISYLPTEGHAAWVLQRGGDFIHRLEPDEAELPQVTQSIRLPGGQGASLDPVLGLLLHTRYGVSRLTPGQPWELQLLQSLDAGVGRPDSQRDATVHRMLSTDVTGDGQQELLLSDDQRHQLVVLVRQDDGLEPLLSWQVYDDKRYPYAYGNDDRSAEPRAVVGLDLDGDGHRDLAMLAHDRLILYLGRAEPEVTP